MEFVTYFDMNKLFALSASVIRRLSTADKIITPKGAAMCELDRMPI